MSTPQSVELLEARLVMTTPTPPIDLTTATSDAATAQAALTTAQNSAE